jgi:hypothetical protein
MNSYNNIIYTNTFVTIKQYSRMFVLNNSGKDCSRGGGGVKEIFMYSHRKTGKTGETKTLARRFRPRKGPGKRWKPRIEVGF